MTRFIIYTLLFYLVFRYFIKPLFGEKPPPEKENREKYPREGEIKVEYKPPNKNQKNEDGEYVDYEEIK